MINGFFNEYKYLSNFYEGEIIDYNGLTYKNAEAAFQAQKTLKKNTRKYFCELQPKDAKTLGRKIELRSDWEDIKDNIMLEIIRAKFKDEYLKEKLLKTGAESLVEVNWWHDNYWGDCHCNKCKNTLGKNMLGRILMQVRKELDERKLKYPAIYKHFKGGLYMTMGISKVVTCDELDKIFKNIGCINRLDALEYRFGSRHTETKEDVIIYKDNKGNFYHLKTVDNNTNLIIYKTLYDGSGAYARPMDMFLSKVDKEKYPQSTQEYRFEEL